MNLIWQIVGILGGVGALSSVVAGFVAKWLADRTIENHKSELTKEVERLKGELNRDLETHKGKLRRQELLFAKQVDAASALIAMRQDAVRPASGAAMVPGANLANGNHRQDHQGRCAGLQGCPSRHAEELRQARALQGQEAASGIGSGKGCAGRSASIASRAVEILHQAEGVSEVVRIPCLIRCYRSIADCAIASSALNLIVFRQLDPPPCRDPVHLMAQHELQLPIPDSDDPKASTGSWIAWCDARAAVQFRFPA